MPCCTQQVKWVPWSKCFEYSGISNSKIGGNGVTARKCMCREYSFDYLRMLLHSFAYINHRPSFDGGLHQCNILEICHVVIMQQQYKDVSVIRNNSDFAFCIFVAQLKTCWTMTLSASSCEVARSAREMTTPPSLISIGTGSAPVTTNLWCRVLSSWNFSSWTRSWTVSCISCFLFLEEASRIFCAGSLLLTCKGWTLLTPVALDPLVTLFVL